MLRLAIRGALSLRKPNSQSCFSTLVNPQFIVGTQNGFLPVSDPLVELPARFAALESLLQRMPIHLKTG